VRSQIGRHALISEKRLARAVSADSTVDHFQRGIGALEDSFPALRVSDVTAVRERVAEAGDADLVGFDLRGVLPLGTETLAVRAIQCSRAVRSDRPAEFGIVHHIGIVRAEQALQNFAVRLRNRVREDRAVLSTGLGSKQPKARVRRQFGCNDKQEDAQNPAAESAHFGEGEGV